MPEKKDEVARQKMSEPAEKGKVLMSRTGRHAPVSQRPGRRSFDSLSKENILIISDA